MILVDTSVLIDFLRNKTNEAVEKFNTVLDLKIPFGITSQIYQELLQGTESEHDFQTLKKYLDTWTFYSPKDEKKTYAQAAHLYFHCRRHGVTIKSSVDCLIVQLAIEYNLKVLHNDKDFDHIKKVIPELQFWSI